MQSVVDGHRTIDLLDIDWQEWPVDANCKHANNAYWWLANVTNGDRCVTDGDRC